MVITLNHTIVPAHDKEASAKFFAKIFGLMRWYPKTRQLAKRESSS